MGSYGSTCRRRPTCPATVNWTWTKSRCASISAHARRWALKLRRVDYRPVLHRPLETTPVIGNVTWTHFSVSDNAVYRELSGVGGQGARSLGPSWSLDLFDHLVRRQDLTEHESENSAGGSLEVRR